MSKKEKLIKRAKLLGVREARDTLIFTTVNYTLYSFWVEYEDGSSDVIECAPISPGESKRKQREQKLLFDKLMDIANQSKNSTSAAPETDTAMLDTLQKIHDLHESGALPDDVFEKKRSEILRKLSDPENQASFAQNVTVVRMGARKCGESKTILMGNEKRLIWIILSSSTWCQENIPLGLSEELLGAMNSHSLLPKAVSTKLVSQQKCSALMLT